MLCQNCKKEIPEDSGFCPFCGSQSLQASVPPSDTLTCPFCGAEHEGDAQYCIACGADMWNLKQNPTPPPQKRKVGIIVIALVTVAVIVSTGVWFFLHRNKTEEPEKETVSITGKIQEDDPGNAKEDRHERLQADLQAYIQNNGVNDTVSVYYADLKDQEEYQYRSQSMRAGQSGRIFVLEYIVESIKNGTMTRTPELINTIKKAIGGDEPASHDLVTLITGDFAQGLDLVAEYTKQQGYTDTLINRFNGDIGNHISTEPNRTSVRDTGKSITAIYQAAQSGDAFAQEVLDLLATNASLKQGIAIGATQGAKNRSISNLEASYTVCENDTALIIQDGHPVVISIMISNLTEDEDEHERALENIQTVSRKICNDCME